MKKNRMVLSSLSRTFRKREVELTRKKKSQTNLLLKWRSKGRSHHQIQTTALVDSEEADGPSYYQSLTFKKEVMV